MAGIEGAVQVSNPAIGRRSPHGARFDRADASGHRDGVHGRTARRYVIACHGLLRGPPRRRRGQCTDPRSGVSTVTSGGCAAASDGAAAVGRGAPGAGSLVGAG